MARRNTADKPEEGTVINELTSRLAELEQEYRIGEERLQELSRQAAVLRETMLRISGAVQVLHELLGSTNSPSACTSSSSSGHAGESAP